MKRVIFFLIISIPFMFTQCDFINTKILGKESPEDTMAAYQARLDSIRRADSIKKIEQREADSLARLDSIKEAKEQAKADSIDRIKKARAQNKYHIISGSFRNDSYAQRYKKRMEDNHNYDNTRILQARNGFNLVSIKSYPDYRQALNELRNIRSQDNFPVWVYKSN